jgi:endonuclease YncB( thermonuclease family)
MPRAPQIPAPQATTDLLRAASLGPATRFAAGSAGPAPHDLTPAAEPPTAEWREEAFATVTVADGRTLLAGGVRIQLVGLDLPMPEQVCRTLDGRLEYCTARAATQLELLTRWKRVTCHYRVERAGEAIGRCRVGTGDLADRMVKTGYAWGAAATRG